jgi:hypothetical protein
MPPTVAYPREGSMAARGIVCNPSWKLYSELLKIRSYTNQQANG